MLLLAVLISFMLLLTVVDIEFWNVCEEWVYWFDFILLLWEQMEGNLEVYLKVVMVFMER